MTAKRFLRMAAVATLLASVGCTRYWCEHHGYCPAPTAAAYPCCVPCCCPCPPAAAAYPVAAAPAPATTWGNPCTCVPAPAPVAH